ncbi:MAG: YkgJ family cysteine cluster protein [Candidatus Kapabacteria bacterium]|nr:YkgJ family cysteine cluster protein [Candidatus Kapabacteria bacterium]
MKTNTISKLNETIIKDYPRMHQDDKFVFECHPGVSCFNKCCNDVNIFLTPYDIIRLKNRLGITSSEFLDKYTLLPIDENLRHPIVMLRMNDDNMNCPFVTEKGCSVYEDRPWSCRMYPVGVASPNEAAQSDGNEFYFLLKEEVCKGFEKGTEWTIQSWMENQGVEEYNYYGDLFKEISLHEKLLKLKAIEPVKLEMFYMVCYDIDKFREFLFESSFFKRFDIDNEKKEKMRTDDLELLKFGLEWLRFSLFGEKTIKVREEYLQPV